jgi:hypothetical protein
MLDQFSRIAGNYLMVGLGDVEIVFFLFTVSSTFLLFPFPDTELKSYPDLFISS